MKTKKYGSNNPYNYSEHSEPQKVTAYEIIRQFKPQFKKEDILVDVGCGTGAISIDLSKYVGKVYAFDISAEAIEYAKKLYSSSEHQNVIFFTADAKYFTLPEKVDWVFSANSLHWLKHLEQKYALSRIKEALKDDGKLIITFGMRHEPLWTVIEKSVSSKRWSKHCKSFQNPRAFYTLEQYKKLLTSAGFELLNIQSKPITYKFKNIDEMLSFVKSWLPHVNCIPKEEKANYMQYLGLNYLSHRPAEKNGSVYITFNVLEIAAQKSFFVKKIKKITEAN